ncbi:MAG: glycosylasparaginase [Flavobacteriaceae bacterium CG_4_8_14_3_um_filter_34_10]|nr:N(4)-(beta-N-acetylglucosaminyl)-L-asparaginase [Flavobacteriia bacterium]OIP49716.1 MAG: glycosylasparaginase [Flavobacteriaceae bacterium CG2_30_34_30]PIQ19297.1 MAG: glycosylasparaginase [Flavobacteriaceae bacterium CG18_big_fil_WC_8_21_14_2_50_34_36]PIV48506.1 MAG: glycosylasparaginase [Flavobacteriaceae bacterium CG02_land_8_20_14_3_00_34_13]PIX08676.1 MAG: glycosylasparaginase [Flavobacteriaceae bacterium CG_4_8_14_3_um_filter_34_10]PIZ08760.1 MAG: glycosylasparaginase [Flavobacteriac
MNRRKFIQNTAITGIGISAGMAALACAKTSEEKKTNTEKLTISGSFPLVIATWDVKEATAKAWEVMQKGGSSLDAIEQGCMVEEANADGQSVGIGGLPDRDGNVTLDACIMNPEGDYGAVVYLQNILHPISVARKVMEETPHVLLAGKGAEQFALEIGFEKVNLLTENSKKAWEAWKITSQYQPIINIENHDTIGMLAIDQKGNISGGCTTSGLAYKMAGRVGDSPIIGSGLFVDNEVGAATATGLGEEVLKTVGSFLIVELMRQGKSPQEACEEAINRIVKKSGERIKDFQVGYIAVNKQGQTGAYSIQKGFVYTVYQNEENKKHIPEYYMKS